MKTIELPQFRMLVPLVALLCFLPAPASSASVRNVLLLQSYHHGFEWTDRITEGVESVLEGKKVPVLLRIEYMDARHVKESADERLVFESYRRKFANARFDLVISADTEAFQFLRRHRDDLFPGVPVVFCGVNDYVDSMLDGRSDITGVAESLDVKETLEAALKAHPDTRQVFVFVDNTEEGTANRRVAARALAALNDRVRGNYIDCYSLREMKAKGFCLPPASIVLMMAIPCDDCGGASGEYLSSVAENWFIPVYGVWDFFLGKGIVGGSVADGYSQGAAAAEIALRVLSGEKAGSIPVVKGVPNRYRFDYRQIRRLGIDPSFLPEGSTVINAPPYFRWHGSGYFWGSVVVIGFLSSAVVFLSMNVRRRRRAEEAAVRASRQFDTLVQAIPDAVFFKDIEGRHLAINRAGEMLMGRSREEILGKTDRELLPPDLAESCLKSDVEALKGDHLRQVEEKIAHPDGSLTYFETFKAPIHDGKGAVIGLAGVSRDVTKRKRAEEMLRASERRYRTLVDLSPDGIAKIGSEGKILMLNQQCARMLGYESQEELLGRSIYEFIVPEDHPRVNADLAHILETGSLPIIRYHLVRRDGTRFPAECSAAIGAGRDGHPGSVMTIVRDVTEKSTLEKQLFQAMKMEAIGRLAGGLAHDINNYLGAITGFSDLVKITHGNDPVLARRMDSIAETAVRASSLIRQLLAFSRKQPSTPEVLDLNKVITGMESMMNRLIGEDVKLVTRLAENPRKVKADPSQIEQIIANLLVNARDAMPDGGELAIETSSADIRAGEPGVPDYMEPGSYLMLAVSDTGTGIPEEIREKIFDPFFTTKETGKGSGLGLATVYGIVKQHGGYIQVRDHPPRGSMFTILLPECGPSAGAMPAPAPPDHPHPAARGSEMVLLAEDNEEVRESTSALLEAMGYGVRTASNGEEAIRIFEAHREEIDLLITDVVMPGMGGKILADRASALNPGLKVLYISGYPEEVIATHGILKEGIRYLQKPFSARELSVKIGDMLERPRGVPPETAPDG